jgi:hypothetical protein
MTDHLDDQALAERIASTEQALADLALIRLARTLRAGLPQAHSVHVLRGDPTTGNEITEVLDAEGYPLDDADEDDADWDTATVGPDLERVLAAGRDRPVHCPRSAERYCEYAVLLPAHGA